jgi:5-formyltetrahydrofolate cyclo-ligase
MQTKTRQRNIIEQRLSTIPIEQIQQQSRSMCDVFLQSDYFLDSNVIMAYIALAKEASPSIIIERALDNGKTVAVPLIDWQDKQIIPVKLKSLTKGLKRNRYGILEPQEIEQIGIGDIDVVIVPGLGFDMLGNRLGRGGGFYDKFLADSRLKAKKCGFALQCQILEQIVTTDWDIPVDILITPEKTHDYKNS